MLFRVLEINIFADSKYLLLSIKVGNKINIPAAKIGSHGTCPKLVQSHESASCQIEDLTKFHMVKGIDNAFDHMELCLVLQAEVILSEIGVYITDINFTAEFLGSNFLLTTFSTVGKLDFQVANRKK